MLSLKADARMHMAFAREEVGSPLVEQGGLQLMGLSRVTLIGLRLSWRHPPACRGSPSTTAGTCSRFESNISVPPRRKAKAAAQRRELSETGREWLSQNLKERGKTKAKSESN